MFSQGKPALRVGRLALCLAMCLASAVVLPVAANASTTLDHFALDSYFAGNAVHTPAATSRIKLKKGHLYVATAQGTFSYYGAINYIVPQPPWTILCGTPESAPQFGSAGGSGPVGFDSEFVFARPWLPEPCAHAKLPVKWINFQMKASAGAWSHPNALNLGSSPAPSPTHTYEYAVVGGGRRVGFRLFDIFTRDNYGSLKIALRAATSSDCAAPNFSAFGFATEAECVTAAMK